MRVDHADVEITRAGAKSALFRRQPLLQYAFLHSLGLHAGGYATRRSTSVACRVLEGSGIVCESRRCAKSQLSAFPELGNEKELGNEDGLDHV